VNRGLRTFIPDQMEHYFISFLLLCSLSIEAQQLEVLKKTDSVFKEVRADAGFPLIDSPAGDPGIRFVASIRASMKKRSGPNIDLNVMKDEIGKMAKKWGANSYSVREYLLSDSSAYIILTLDTYLSSEQALKMREDQRPTNILYVAIDPNWYNRGIFRFRFNKEKISLGYREYFVYSTRAGDKISLKKGIAGQDISVFGGMPAVMEYYYSWQPLQNNAEHFYEARGKDIDWLYLHTFYIHPKTCAGCVIPLNAIPKAAGRGSE
jgi:hypothetical protein